MPFSAFSRIYLSRDKCARPKNPLRACVLFLRADEIFSTGFLRFVANFLSTLNQQLHLHGISQMILRQCVFIQKIPQLLIKFSC